MKKYIFILLPLLAFCSPPSSHENSTETNDVTKSIHSKATEALAFCKENNMHTEYCILIDMNIHSGKNRFFVYNFNTDSIVDQGLVSHGCGDKPWGMDFSKENPAFSNTPDSHLSSLGKYKIGKRGYSNWGIHINYKLHGLEKLNSNAYKRFIVLHSWAAMPTEEIFPTGAPEGWGCPALSDEFMKRIDKRLHKNNQPVLLWIFNK